LENILSSFHESLSRPRLCEHDLFSVRSTAFISTVIKSPDETWIKYKALWNLVNNRILHQWSREERALPEVRESRDQFPCWNLENTQKPVVFFEKQSHLHFEVEAIFETSYFSKKCKNSSRPVVRTKDLCMTCR